MTIRWGYETFGPLLPPEPPEPTEEQQDTDEHFNRLTEPEGDEDER